MGFSTALSGLKGASTTLSVTGNNIANSQTAGFKESRTQFGDVYTSAMGSSGKTAVGSGVRVSSVAQQFKQGTIEATGNALDLAISGEGFFALGDLVDPIIPDKPLEATSYTRNGAFHINNKGNVVDDNGRYLLAFKPTGTTVAEGFDVGVKLPLRIDTDQGVPTATSAVDMKLNLNGAANSAVIPFSFTTPGVAPYIPDPKTYTHTTSITTYDSLGNAHIVSTYFAKTDVPNEWDAYTFLDGRSVQPGVQSDPYAIPPIMAAGAVVLPAGTITTTPTRVVFDAKGALSSVSPQATPLDTARSEEARARMKLSVATAQAVTDLSTVDSSVLNVERGAAALVTSLSSQIKSLNATDPTNVNLPALQAAFDSLKAEYGDPADKVTNPIIPLGASSSFTNSTDLANEIKTNFSGHDVNNGGTAVYDSTQAASVIDSLLSPALTKQYAQLDQAVKSLKQAHNNLASISSTAVNSQINIGAASTPAGTGTGLSDKYGVALDNLLVAQKEAAATALKESAAGSPIQKIANTKIDFGTIDLSAINPGLEAASFTFKIDLSGSTQFSNPFTVNDLKQNGLPVGNLTGVDVDKSGIVYAKYSNGFAKPLGQVALARFADNQSLAKVGNTTWLATSDSGAPIYGAGGDNNFGTIQSSAIENSNVDLSEQLVKLIVAQQAYQANSQTVTTEKTLVETILRV